MTSSGWKQVCLKKAYQKPKARRATPEGLARDSATNPPSAAQACMDAAVSWLGGAP